LARDLLDLQDDELRGLERREADHDVDDPVIDIILGRRLVIALDEVRVARRFPLEGALAKQVLHEGPDVEADLGPEGLVIGLEDHPFRVHPAEARAGLEKRGDADSTGSCVNGLQNREVRMSTSLLYQVFGIRGYEYIRTDYRGGQTLVTIRQDPDD